MAMIILHNCTDDRDTPTARDECGVRDGTNRETQCPRGGICVLERNLNLCVESKFF